MTNTVCIHQPDFLPYLGFFDRLLDSNHFIILDDVQFIRRGWHHRDIIKTPNGNRWLTLSIKKGDFLQKISDVQLSQDKKWIDDNLALIRENYKKSRYFDLIYPQVESIYLKNHQKLIDFNLDFLDLALSLMCIKIDTSFSSSYNLKSTGSLRLCDLVSAVKGDQYLAGVGARHYLDEGIFQRSNIDVKWQQFIHPEYTQLHGTFEPMISCLDLFFCCGNDSATIIRSKHNER